MNSSGGNVDEPLPEPIRRRIHEKTEQFIAAWKEYREAPQVSANRPDIKSLLLECKGDERVALFKELLDAEVYYRRQLGESPTAAEYEIDFGEFVEVIHRLFGDAPTAKDDTLDLTHADEAHTPFPSVPLGSQIGPYKLVQLLGRGGMGTVYVAEVCGRCPGVRTGTRVALKIIHPHVFGQHGFFKRFLREVELGKSVRHPNVVRTLDVDVAICGGQQLNYLVMEYIEGQDLRALVRELGRVPDELCRHIGAEVSTGLAALHDAGVIHRDIKPANVAITQDNVVKVMDLGLARIQDEPIQLSTTGQFLGTVLYAAPEQFEGAELDGRTDLYSLGMTLYALAAGFHPFEKSNALEIVRQQREVQPTKLGEVNPQVSPFLEEVVHTLIAKNRDQRFTSARELTEILAEGERSPWWHRRSGELRSVTRRPLRRIRIRRETALLGRGEELALLRRAFQQAKTSDAQVVLIEGEAGVGKTRLVDEFVSDLYRDGEHINFLVGSYPPGGAATGAGALLAAYREHFGSDGQGLREFPGIDARVARDFGSLLRGEPIEHDLGRDALHGMVLVVTEALAAERPTVVLVDDLHFAPDEGRSLFAFLASSLRDAPVLLLGTSRFGLPKDWLGNLLRYEHVQHLRLDRLEQADFRELLKGFLASDSLVSDLGDEIFRKSDGNPFFALEILHDLVERRYLKRSANGSLIRDSEGTTISIPSSVTAVVQARIADLQDEDRQLLEAASCCGFEFDPLLVGESLGWERIPTLRRLAQLEDAQQLVHARGRRFVFDHHQIQETLCAALPDPLREEYHAAIGKTLESRESTRECDPSQLDGELCVTLSEHLLRGACAEPAMRYVIRALDFLRDNGLTSQTLVMADKALCFRSLRDEDRLTILLRKSFLLTITHRLDEQREVLDEAQSLTEKVGSSADKFEVARQFVLMFGNSGNDKECQEWSQELTRLSLESGDPVQLATSTLYRYDHLDRESASSGVIGQLEKALRIFQEEGDAHREAKCACMITEKFAFRGEYGMALEFANCSHIASHKASVFLEAKTYLTYGKLFLAVGDHEKAISHLNSARDRHSKLLTRQMLRNDCLYLGFVELSQGCVEEAESLFAEARGIFEGRDNSTDWRIQISLANYYLCEGNYEGASRYLERASVIVAEKKRETPPVQTFLLCLLPNADLPWAKSFVDELPSDMSFVGRMQATFLYWRASRDRTYLERAHEMLERLREHAPEEYRESMIENVHLYRQIVDAYRGEFGGALDQ